MTTDLASAWKPYVDLMDQAELEKLISIPVSLAGEEPEGVLPCISMGENGPKIESVFLRTKSLLSEISCANQLFDYVPLYSIFNYRVFLGQVAFRGKNAADGEPPKMLDSATIELVHIATTFKSRMTYIGSNREGWLSQLSTFVPVKTILDSWFARRPV